MCVLVRVLHVCACVCMRVRVNVNAQDSEIRSRLLLLLEPPSSCSASNLSHPNQSFPSSVQHLLSPLAPPGAQVSEQDKQAFADIFTEVFNAVDSKQLRPFIRTQYMRTAFQVRACTRGLAHACTASSMRAHLVAHGAQAARAPSVVRCAWLG